LDDVTQFCLEEASLEAHEGDELLLQLEAHKRAEPAYPPDVQRQIDAFRSFRS
jgi:hypothetical protein